MGATEARCATYCVLALYSLTSATGNSSSSPKLHEPFVGQEYWMPEFLDMCEMEERQQNSLYCGTYTFDYQRINFEVVSDDPILIIFRSLLTQQLVNELLHDISTMDLSPQRVVNSTSETYGDLVSPVRVTNGTQVSDEYTPALRKAYRMSQSALPFVNFTSSEGWQILSYLPGGHYADHYDYIEPGGEGYDDGWLSTHQNRFATFLLVLQNAKVGGGTVFPQLETTVKANPGDAVFWLNMDAQQELEPLSLHGGCVVREGEKIVVVQWIRALDQDILKSASSGGMFDIEKLTSPDRYFYGKCRAEEDFNDLLGL
ncbi:hypothetical protein Q1695_014489 [Nippostrongylus brasiliensis]|nr:hypothetical protein Q1695_014489 [Nippostrongylus brasiliensis]